VFLTAKTRSVCYITIFFLPVKANNVFSCKLNIDFAGMIMLNRFFLVW